MINCKLGKLKGNGHFLIHRRILDAVSLYRMLKRDDSLPDYIKNLVSSSESSCDLRGRVRVDVSCKTSIGATSFCWRLR